MSWKFHKSLLIFKNIIISKFIGDILFLRYPKVYLHLLNNLSHRLEVGWIKDKSKLFFSTKQVFFAATSAFSAKDKSSLIFNEIILGYCTWSEYLINFSIAIFSGFIKSSSEPFKTLTIAFRKYLNELSVHWNLNISTLLENRE
jgi:hypothetical protein